MGMEREGGINFELSRRQLKCRVGTLNGRDREGETNSRDGARATDGPKLFMDARHSRAEPRGGERLEDEEAGQDDAGMEGCRLCERGGGSDTRQSAGTNITRSAMRELWHTENTPDKDVQKPFERGLVPSRNLRLSAWLRSAYAKSGSRE